MMHSTKNHCTLQQNFSGSSKLQELLTIIAHKTNYAPKRYGNGYMVKCPNHADTRPSLSISEGTDEKVLIYCHAGCTTQEICDAIGVPISYLFPNKKRQYHKSYRLTQAWRKS